MIDVLFYALVFPGLAFTVLLAFWFEYVERKLTARIQKRVGPLYTGFKGTLQPVADFVKLLLKEELVPRTTDRLLYVASPIVACSIPILGMTILPITDPRSLLGFREDVYFLLFLFILESFAVVLMGIAVLTPYTVIGVGRHILQYTMYEGVFMLAVASVAVQTRSVGIDQVIEYQELHGPILLYQPLGFVVAVIALLAKLEKRPFDLPHAKQEIVTGWMTEYSGASLALVRLYSYLSMVWSSSIIADMYLGGPGWPLGVGGWQGFLLFFLKLNVVLVLLTVVSASTGRIRVVGLARRFWGFLYPLAVVQFVLATVMRYAL
ncbi:Membrane-bound hydrogenase, subunit NuoH [Thermogladius calderae 1633]|uniref:Membrane-bound hydrogenase, subunit NuoH n=1 Tax=Thermogladius calderae (strain DSM 22663 / VKM B-2946 / 1633) TaxID=1184251 RepID=I3TEY0_THEC1|nr:complex I subunit 1 family protein [Thermogladius calderae]AFK51318.1 Membrane-bound hydrogenase, subunit NuoH [Thermogladius calderae 1633]